jgi:hypothetical protein
VIAAAIFTSFRCRWPRDVGSLSSSASILIARIPLVRGERPGLCKIRSRAARCVRASALAVVMVLSLHPTGIRARLRQLALNGGNGLAPISIEKPLVALFEGGADPEIPI